MIHFCLYNKMILILIQSVIFVYQFSFLCILNVLQFDSACTYDKSKHKQYITILDEKYDDQFLGSVSRTSSTTCSFKDRTHWTAELNRSVLFFSCKFYTKLNRVIVTHTISFGDLIDLGQNFIWYCDGITF